MFVLPSVSRFVPILLPLAFCTGHSAWAGSFLQAPSTWQVINSLSVSTSRLKYDPRGVLVTADPYRKIEAAWLVEYGLTGEVTLIANPVLRDVALTQASGTMTGHGLSSFEGGARWRLFDWRVGVVSFQATTRVPGRSDPAFAFENRPSTELRLGYGTPAIVNGKEGFVDASAAWIKRHDSQPDEVRLEMTYGWRRRFNRLFLLQYMTTAYPGAGMRGGPWQHKVQTSTVYLLSKNWAFQVGSYITRGGRETRHERGTVMAVWRQF